MLETELERVMKDELRTLLADLENGVNPSNSEFAAGVRSLVAEQLALAVARGRLAAAYQ